MSTRMQVFLSDVEYERFKGIAQERGMTLAEWVRSTLREASRSVPQRSAAKKIAAIRQAAKHEFPAPDIDTMLAEIADGIATDLPQ